MLRNIMPIFAMRTLRPSSLVRTPETPQCCPSSQRRAPGGALPAKVYTETASSRDTPVYSKYDNECIYTHLSVMMMRKTQPIHPHRCLESLGARKSDVNQFVSIFDISWEAVHTRSELVFTYWGQLIFTRVRKQPKIIINFHASARSSN